MYGKTTIYREHILLGWLMTTVHYTVRKLHLSKKIVSKKMFHTRNVKVGTVLWDERSSCKIIA